MKIFEKIVKLPKKTLDTINFFLDENKSLFGRLSEFILINSKDNGKNYLIDFFNMENQLMYSYVSYRYCDELEINNKKSYEFEYYSENDLEDELSPYSIIRHAINCENIFIIHEYFGWQQVFNSYVYRGFANSTKLQCYALNNGDSCFDFERDIDSDKLLVDYDRFIKTLDLLPHNFTLPLLAYCIFSYTKTLYKQYGHKVDITKVDNHFALNIIPTDDTNINKTMINFAQSFSQFTIKEKIFSPKEYLSEMGVIKNLIFTDFPVFIYNSNKTNSEFKTSISSSTFHKAVTSNISYIYYNLDKFGDYLLNLTVSDNVERLSVDKEIQAKFPNKLLDGYLEFVSSTLSYESCTKEKEREKKLIKKIYEEDYEGHIYQYIYDFIDDICRIRHSKGIKESKIFFNIFSGETKKFTIKEFEALEREYSKENRINYTDFAQKYYDKHLLNYEFQFENKRNNSNSESNRDFVAYIMHERYVGILVNNYLSISKYHPTYFDNLYKNATKYLKDNLKGKKYDSVQLTHCSFLLAAMMSFKEYIDDCLPENSDNFNKYYQEFLNIVLQMCCEPCNESIDNSAALYEFSVFLNAEIANNSIIDVETGADSDIGWIDRKKNKIFLKNTSGNIFYNKFTNYLINHHKHFELSKQAFVRDVLEENGIITPRYAGGGKRYDCERKILNDRPKFRVLVLDCTRLNIKQ